MHTELGRSQVDPPPRLAILLLLLLLPLLLLLLLRQHLLHHLCLHFHVHCCLANSSPSSVCPSSVYTAGPQPGTFPAHWAPLDLNLGPAQLSVHRWTSTWDLPSSVCTAAPQPGTFPAQCALLDVVIKSNNPHLAGGEQHKMKKLKNLRLVKRTAYPRYVVRVL